MIRQQSVQIPVAHATLEGELEVAAGAAGLVVFVHGSGSSRFSVRNQFVARHLREQNLGTLLFDLLTPDEERIDAATAHLRFDIQLLAGRLLEVSRWLRDTYPSDTQRVGYFGSSTGGGAALVAAADPNNPVAAVVSRGGRPDLAGAALANVLAPTLLLVGGEDTPVIELNQQALRVLRSVKRLQIIPGASHLFEERGTLEQVAQHAAEWFNTHFRGPAPVSPASSRP